MRLNPRDREVVGEAETPERTKVVAAKTLAKRIVQIQGPEARLG